MLSRNELLTALRAQRARRDELLGVDAQQWAWHCGACYAIAAALGIDPNGPIPDDEPEPEPDAPGEAEEAATHEFAAALGLTREDYEILPDPVPDASTLSGG